MPDCLVLISPVGGIAVMSSPLKRMAPFETGWRPTMARIRLVLPTPLRPSTQVTLPGSAVSDTPRSAWAAP